MDSPAGSEPPVLVVSRGLFIWPRPETQIVRFAAKLGAWPFNFPVRRASESQRVHTLEPEGSRGSTSERLPNKEREKTHKAAALFWTNYPEASDADMKPLKQQGPGEFWRRSLTA